MANKNQRANDALLMAILQAYQGNPQGLAAATAVMAMSDIKRDGADQGDVHNVAANSILDQAGDINAKVELIFDQHPEIEEDLNKYMEDSGLQFNNLAELIQSYLQEKVKYTKGEFVLEYQTGGKTNEFPIFKNGQKCNTKECAEFQNDTLRKAGFSTYGNAWNVGNAKLYWSGYDIDSRPEQYDLSKVREYNFKAADKFLKDFNSATMLDRNKKYIVNMFYKGSPVQEQAYNEGRDGIAGTHTGYVSWNPQTNQWEVTHNIHGKIHVDPFTKIQGRSGQYGITAIFVPKKNIIDKAKEWAHSTLGFGSGGQFENDNVFIQVTINGIKYKLLHLITDEEKESGLMDVEQLDPQEGALFDYSDEPQAEFSFWMKDTTIPLLICFINENGKVISVHKGKPLSEEKITESSEFVAYVIEVGMNENINPGDQTSLGNQNINEETEDEDEEDIHPELNVNRLYVYGSDGEVQAELQGGERIFSRKSSKVIIAKAKRAYVSKENKDYKALGRYIFKEMDAQDNRPAEYVNEN